MFNEAEINDAQRYMDKLIQKRKAIKTGLRRDNGFLPKLN
jgi:hypothetical protein